MPGVGPHREGAAITTDHSPPSARYSAIIEWLASDGRVDVVQAAARLKVAQETIRRDLRALEAHGKLQRVHGGAVPLEVRPIAVTSAPWVENDQLDFSRELWRDLPRSGTLLLGAGQLTLALAHAIAASPPDRPGLTVVTNSLDAAIVLSRTSTLSVYNVGGTVSPLTRAQEGDWALTELSRFSVDVCVVAPCGVSVQHGLSEDTPTAAAVSEAVVSAGKRVIVLANCTTLNTAAFVQFAGLDKVDLVAVSDRPSAEELMPLRGYGLTVTVLGTEAGEPDDSDVQGGADVPGGGGASFIGQAELPGSPAS